MSDISSLIEEATAKGTFSVLDVAKGRGYPQDIIDIYMDQDSAYRAHALEKQIADETDGDVVNALDEARKDLIEKVKNSRLTFHMRGIAPGVVEGFRKAAKEKFNDPDVDQGAEASEWFGDATMAAHIVKVINANDDVDDHKWSADDVATLRAMMPDESFIKLVRLRSELTFAAAYFDEAVDANFS